MTRRVPELALVVGVLLALPVAVYGLLFSTAVLPTLLVSLAVCYAFAAYAIVTDDDPATVLRPVPILAGTGLVAFLVTGYGAVTTRPLFGLLVGLVAVGPAVAYHVRYGEQVNPFPLRATLAVGVLAAAIVLGYAVAVARDPVGSVDAALLLLVTLDYRAERGGPLDGLAEMLVVACCTGGGALVVLAFVAAGTPVTGLALAAPFLAVGAFVAMPA